MYLLLDTKDNTKYVFSHQAEIVNFLRKCKREGIDYYDIKSRFKCELFYNNQHVDLSELARLAYVRKAKWK